MKPDAFFETLTHQLETASDALLLEAAQTNPDLPMPPTAKHRLETMRAQEQAKNPS